MKIIPKNNLLTFSLPLPIYKSVQIADAIGQDGEEFGVLVGLDKGHVEQLKDFSMNEDDVDLQKNTGDRVRFGVGSYDDWYAKNRTPFCLIHKQTDALAALVWLGPLPLYEDKNNWHTAGWRSYNPFRGKGLMRTFSNFCINFYLENMNRVENNIKLWAAVKRGNTGSLGLATGLGFQVLEEASDDESLVMVK